VGAPGSSFQRAPRNNRVRDFLLAKTEDPQGECHIHPLTDHSKLKNFIISLSQYDFRKLVRENPSLLTAKGLEKCREMSQVMLEIGISENGVKAQLER